MATSVTGLWPWTYFTPQELACKCCGEECAEQALLAATLNAIQTLRAAWGGPVAVNSAHRCAKHNKAVGGVANSMHRTLALDCRCPAADQDAFVALARRVGFRGIGRYPSRGFVHLDMGPAREWRG